MNSPVFGLSSYREPKLESLTLTSSSLQQGRRSDPRESEYGVAKSPGANSAMTDPDNLHDTLVQTLQQIKDEMARLQASLEALKKQIAALDVPSPESGPAGPHADAGQAERDRPDRA